MCRWIEGGQEECNAKTEIKVKGRKFVAALSLQQNVIQVNAKAMDQFHLFLFTA